MIKVAFLDRDGTINKDYPDDQWKYIKCPEFLEGSIAGMQNLVQNGYQIIIITNQYIINDGIISIEDYHSFTQALVSELKESGINILNIYFCPHNDTDHCSCKKPNPGLIQQALKQYDIDMSASIYCGDSEVDYWLAQHYGLPFYGIHYQGSQNAVIHCASLLEASMKLGLQS